MIGRRCRSCGVSGRETRLLVVAPMWRPCGAWSALVEEMEGSRSGSGGVTMERVGDRNTRKGCVAGSGRKEVREETRACVGVNGAEERRRGGVAGGGRGRVMHVRYWRTGDTALDAL